MSVGTNLKKRKYMRHIKIKVKIILKQATKARKGSRRITLLFL